MGSSRVLLIGIRGGAVRGRHAMMTEAKLYVTRRREGTKR